MTALGEEIREQSEVESLRLANRHLQKALGRATAKTQDVVDAVYRAAKDAAVILGPAPAVKVPKAKAGKGKPEVALIHATDWQYGKSTASYGMDKCAERIALFSQKVRTITEIQRADHPVNECRIMWGGDMVEGVGIFPGQAYEIEAHLFEQLFGVVQIMEMLVRDMLSLFPLVHVHEEPGNHGRIGRKGDMPAGDNVDRIAYRILRDRFKGCDRIVFHPSINWYHLVKIENYRAMLIHGDEIKSFGGNLPAYGILRKANAWASGVVEQFQDVYVGHFHQNMTLTLANGGRVFVTGSPESDNEYAREFVAATGRPSQRLHFIDPRKGRITGEFVCWLDQG